MNDTMNRQGRSRGRSAAIWAALLLAAATARADQVTLKGGKVVEGEITAETDTHVVITTSGVSVKVKRDSVASIEKLSTPARAVAATPPPSDRPGEEFRTPKEFEGTDMQIQRLDAMRQKLQTVAGVLKGHRGKIRTTETNAGRSQAQHATELDKLNRLRPGTTCYDSAANQANITAASLEKYRAAATRLQSELAQVERTERAYQTAVDEFRLRYQRKKNHFIEANPDHPSLVGYFPRIEKRLEAHARAGTGVYVIPCRFEGPRAYVKVRLNGHQDVDWLVDTGATLCTVSLSLAKKLNVSSTEREAFVTLADGRRSRVKVSVLSQVAVGDLVVQNVPCYIVDDSNAGGTARTDGLMGMSFLERFEMQLSAEEKDLTLRSKSGPLGVNRR